MNHWILGKEFCFEAAHQLSDHDEKHARLHGHSWVGVVYISSAALHELNAKPGMVMDYTEIKPFLKPILEQYVDHYDLNQTTGLQNPTSKELAKWIFEQLEQRALPGLLGVKINRSCTPAYLYTRSAEDELVETGKVATIGDLCEPESMPKLVPSPKNSPSSSTVNHWLIGKEFCFEAAHHLPDHEGKYARIHGHSWKGVVYTFAPVEHSQDTKSDTATDVADSDVYLNPLLENHLNFHHLNKTTCLANPTSEELTQWIFEQLEQQGLPGLLGVKLHGTATSTCLYTRSTQIGLQLLKTDGELFVDNPPEEEAVSDIRRLSKLIHRQ